MENNIFEIIKKLNYNPEFRVFLCCIGFDIFLGTLASIKNRNLNSYINKIGISKHIAIIILVVFCSIIFNPLNMGELINVLILFYIGSYMISIIENLTMLGVPLPKWLIDKFLILKEDNDVTK